jgi:uncharacterized coiled-coil protein SlyX
MEDRVTELEIKVAHLDQTLLELSDALVKQQGYIERLEAGFKSLKEQLDSSGSGAESGDPAAEKPPHY